MRLALTPKSYLLVAAFLVVCLAFLATKGNGEKPHNQSPSKPSTSQPPTKTGSRQKIGPAGPLGMPVPINCSVVNATGAINAVALGGGANSFFTGTVNIGNKNNNSLYPPNMTVELEGLDGNETVTGYDNNPVTWIDETSFQLPFAPGSYSTTFKVQLDALQLAGNVNIYAYPTGYDDPSTDSEDWVQCNISIGADATVALPSDPIPVYKLSGGVIPDSKAMDPNAVVRKPFTVENGKPFDLPVTFPGPGKLILSVPSPVRRVRDAAKIFIKSDNLLGRTKFVPLSNGYLYTIISRHQKVVVKGVFKDNKRHSIRFDAEWIPAGKHAVITLPVQRVTIIPPKPHKK